MKNWQRLKSEPEYRARMEQRSRVLDAIRAFFKGEGFLEVETPIVVKLPGMEPYLDPLRTEVTRHDGKSFPAHLITSPEYAMKKLLAGGLPRIFEITRAFRGGEPWGGSEAARQGMHNPEFTMIEWYRAAADYTAIMADTERMVASVARVLHDTERITYQGREIDLSAPWPRMTVAEAFAKYAHLDLGRGIDDPEWFRAEVAARGCTVTADDTWDDVFFKIFLRDIEPKLGWYEASAPVSMAGAPAATSASAKVTRPLILHEYPRSMAALARLKPGDGRYAERFEAYAGGMEVANAFSELSDPTEQRARLEEERALRQKLGKHDYAIDEQFIEAVGQMPSAAGIALGVDRLVALLTNAASIRDVLYFPASDLFD